MNRIEIKKVAYQSVSGTDFDSPVQACIDDLRTLLQANAGRNMVPEFVVSLIWENRKTLVTVLGVLEEQLNQAKEAEG